MPAPRGEVCSKRTRGTSGLEGSRATATVKSTLAIHDETILFGLGRTPTCILYLTNQLARMDKKRNTRHLGIRTALWGPRRCAMTPDANN